MKSPSEKPDDRQRKARLKRERMFPMARSATSSTSCALVKCRCSSANNSSATTAGVAAMPTARSSTSFSTGVNAPLSR